MDYDLARRRPKCGCHPLAAPLRRKHRSALARFRHARSRALTMPPRRSARVVPRTQAPQPVPESCLPARAPKPRASMACAPRHVPISARARCCAGDALTSQVTQRQRHVSQRRCGRHPADAAVRARHTFSSAHLIAAPRTCIKSHRLWRIRKAARSGVVRVRVSGCVIRVCRVYARCRAWCMLCDACSRSPMSRGVLRAGCRALLSPVGGCRVSERRALEHAVSWETGGPRK